MTGWSLIPYLIPFVFSILVTSAGAVFLIRRRSLPGATPLAFLLTAIAFWSFGYWLELTTATREAKIAWARFQHIGIFIVPPTWLWLALQYTGRGAWLTPRRLALVAAPLVVAVGVAWTDIGFGWTYTNVNIAKEGILRPLVFQPGWFFYTVLIYGFTLMGIGLFMLLDTIRKSPPGVYRARQNLLLLGMLAPLLANVLYVTGINPFAPLDPTPFALSLTGLAAFVAVVQLRLLETSPAARSAVVEYLQDAVFIVAPSGEIVDLNPAASKLIPPDLPPIGKPLHLVLPAQSTGHVLLAVTQPTTLEIDLGEKHVPRFFEASVTPLPGALDSETTRIVVLRDISERRRQMEQLRENEKQLVESQALYHSLVETLPQYILRKDVRSRITFVNQNHLRLNGKTLEEMVGKTDHELYPTEVADKYLQDDIYVMSTGQTIEVVEEHYVDEGEKILVRVVKTPLYSPDGQINGTQCIFWDVTEKERAEQALIESEQRFRTSVESLLDGFAVFSSIRDEHGKIVDFRYEYINEAGCWLNQRSRRDHIGHTLLEVLPGQKESGILDEKIRVVETGQPATRESVVYQDMYGDGKLLTRAFDYQTVKLGDGLAVTWRDVTERKRRETEIEQKNNTIQRMYEELHENERRFRSSIESLLDGFAIFTPWMDDDERTTDFVIEYINEVGCEMLGRTFDDLVGVSLFTTFPSPHSFGELDDYLAVVQTGKPLIREVEIQPRLLHDRQEPERFLEIRAVKFGDGFALSWRDITARKLDEEKRAHWVFELEQRNREIMLLNDLGELLQACRTDDEAYQIIASDMPLFFSGCSGAIYIINNSQSCLEAVAAWGQPNLFAPTLDPGDCWGLRLGKLHFAVSVHPRTNCKHLNPGQSLDSVCTPMIAQNKAFGVLSLAATGSTALSDPATSGSRLQLFQTVAEQISLALANLSLRDTLSRQAIRDPLTNLFNRRYMEETLEREISRAQRKDAGLGLLMIDIDHFKSFNDDYGHDAGDIVLREVGCLLLNRTRKEDVACRYGGEEFLIIIPETGEEDAMPRAEEIRSALFALQIIYHERLLREVTVSIGVAVFPCHGNNVESLLKAADLALYAAKRAGRNQVCLAGG